MRMNDYLTHEIWKMRKNIKTKPGTPLVSLVRVENRTYQLLFMSCGCENACTFCNYGFDYNLSLEMVQPELTKIKLENFDIVELELEEFHMIYFWKFSNLYLINIFQLLQWKLTIIQSRKERFKI